MKCPHCAGQTLKIEVRFQGFVTAFFHHAEKFELTEPVTMTSAWDEDSPCRCQNCDWQGVVGSCRQVPVAAE